MGSNVDSLMITMLQLLPIFVMVAVMIYVLGMFFRDGDYDGFGLMRYWWLIIFMPLPFLLMWTGFNLGLFLIFLIVFAVVGVIILYIIEYGVDMDTVKQIPSPGKAVKTLKSLWKKNFRF